MFFAALRGMFFHFPPPFMAFRLQAEKQCLSPVSWGRRKVPPRTFLRNPAARRIPRAGEVPPADGGTLQRPEKPFPALRSPERGA